MSMFDVLECRKCKDKSDVRNAGATCVKCGYVFQADDREKARQELVKLRESFKR